MQKQINHKYEILKEDGRLLKRNRIHLNRDVEGSTFPLTPDIDEVYPLSDSVFDNSSDNTNFQNDLDFNSDESLNINDSINRPELTNSKHNLTIDNNNETNMNILNYNNRPHRNIKIPKYLNDYETNF